MLALQVDPQTGEIVDDLSFSTLEDAENVFYSLMEQSEALWIRKTKVLVAIRDQQLYRERQDPKTGEPYASFEAYLKGIVHSVAAFDSVAPRTLKLWMASYLILCEQLGFGTDDLMELGTHAHVMQPLAARGRGYQLLETNEETPTGGTRLGRGEFNKFAQRILDNVKTSRENPDVPELQWRVADTQAEVQALLNTAAQKVNLVLDAVLVGKDKVRIDGVTWFLDDLPYHPGEVLDLPVFLAIAKGARVEGLPEELLQ